MLLRYKKPKKEKLDNFNVSVDYLKNSYYIYIIIKNKSFFELKIFIHSVVDYETFGLIMR